MKSILRSLVLRWVWKGAIKKVAAEKPTVIAITGSVGKTSAKEAIALVLEKSERPVLKTAGNLNTESGVPLSLLGFEESPSGLGWLTAFWRGLFPPPTKIPKTHPVSRTPYYVVEYSADQPGDIAFLTGKLPPDLAVLTLISPVHMERYASLEQLAAEKLSLLAGLRSGGSAILNHNDPVQREAGEKRSDVLWYGLSRQPSHRPGVWARGIQLSERGVSCTLDFVSGGALDNIGSKQNQSISLQTAVLGEHQLIPLLAAAAVGWKERLTNAKIKAALEAYRPLPGRGRLIAGQKDILLVDESYNASPTAVKAGLSMLRHLAGKRRVVAILGRMNELGKSALEAHKEVAAWAADKVDFLVVVGEHGEAMLSAAKKNGLASSQMIAFSTPERLMDKLDQVVQRADLVYIKGSQNGVRLERVVKLLMAHPEEASKLLVRQSKRWR